MTPIRRCDNFYGVSALKLEEINYNFSFLQIVEFQIDATTLRTNPLYSVYYTTV